MGRLTEYESIAGHAHAIPKVIDMDCIVAKLAEYEDLEEQGLLLRLPCKVGDEVWYVSFGKVYKGKCHALGLKPSLQIHLYDFDGANASLPANRVFLTEAEAEEALKKKQEGSDV